MKQSSGHLPSGVIKKGLTFENADHHRPWYTAVYAHAEKGSPNTMLARCRARKPRVVKITTWTRRKSPGLPP